MMNSIGDNDFKYVVYQMSDFPNEKIHLMLQRRNVVLLWRNAIEKTPFTSVKCHILIVIIYSLIYIIV